MRLRDVAIGANASMYKRMQFKRIQGVYYPRSEEELLEAIKHAHEKGYDITAKGGGSGLSGACTGGNHDRVMISSLHLRNVRSISLEERYADVGPGATPNEINDKLRPLGMRFYVAPSSRDVATIGGLVSTDGGGNDTWANGTMRDNTVSVRLITHTGDIIVVDKKGVRSANEVLQENLNGVGMTLDDVASSHGTLGFISEVRVAIKAIVEEKTVGAMVEFEDYDSMGAGLLQTIDKGCPVRYGEAIVMAHEDVREGLKPPLLILEFPHDYEMEFCNADVRKLTRNDLAHLQELRLKLPKRNPNVGIQVALFEGYGLHGESLEHMGRTITEIDDVLRNHGMEPFMKYGHAPSKWYLGDNSPAFGLIMHSREIKPEGKSGPEIYRAVEDVVGKCEELGVTPKPEHKWIYSDSVKKKRLAQLREVMGNSFNSFVFEEDCASQTLSSMV